MTAPSSRPTQCPHCGYDNQVETYESINSHDRQLREKLISGALWTWRCANCAKETFSLYPVLYHDMRSWCMVYYLDRQMTEDPRVIERMVPAADQLTALRRFNLNYRFRLCRSLDDFIEKVRVLDAGLDDQAVEYVKLRHSGVPLKTRFERLVDGESKRLEFVIASHAPGGPRASPVGVTYSAYTDALAKIRERMGSEPDVASGFIIVDQSYIEERFPAFRPKRPEPMALTPASQPAGDMGSIVFGKTRSSDKQKPWWRFW
jgi:hypothetical protein